MTAVALSVTEKRSRVAPWGDATLGLLLVAPVIITMLALVFYPLVQTVVDSFHRVNPMQQGTPFVGTANYAKMLSDDILGRTWINTLTYVAIAVTIETVFGVLIASLLNQVNKGRRWLLAAVILPWALPGVVNAVIWRWIFTPGGGLLNGILINFGLPFENHVWFNDRFSAIVAVSVVHVWRNLPLTVVIVLAAMQAIPGHLYEAARIDGATRRQTFFSLTLPLVRSPIAVALANSMVSAFNIFDEAWVLTSTSLDTRPVLTQIYMETFQNLHFSYGMALSLTLTVLTLLVSLVFILRIHNSTRYE